jgi:hypothetical protein
VLEQCQIDKSSSGLSFSSLELRTDFYITETILPSENDKKSSFPSILQYLRGVEIPS